MTAHAPELTPSVVDIDLALLTSARGFYRRPADPDRLACTVRDVAHRHGLDACRDEARFAAAVAEVADVLEDSTDPRDPTAPYDRSRRSLLAGAADLVRAAFPMEVAA